MGLSSTARVTEVFLVLMEFDEEYERLKADRSCCRRNARELEIYVSNKHDTLLQRTLEPGSYRKRFSWVIIDGFAVEITADQADVLRSADGVRVVEKDQELKVPMSSSS